MRLVSDQAFRGWVGAHSVGLRSEFFAFVVIENALRLAGRRSSPTVRSALCLMKLSRNRLPADSGAAIAKEAVAGIWFERRLANG